MRKAHPIRLVMFTALVALSTATAPAAVPDAVKNALNQAPADAPLVFVVPNLNELNASIRTVSNALGVQVPEMTDALTQFKAATRMQQGLNDDGSFVVVVTDPSFAMIETGDGDNAPPMVMLVPVTDYTAFLGNFDAEADGDVTGFQLPNGSQAFSRKLGDYAVLAPTRQLAADFQAGSGGDAILKRMGTLGEQALGDSKAFVYLNMEALGPMMMQGLQLARMQMRGMLMNSPGAAMAEPIMGMYLDAADAVANDASAAVISLNADELGVSVSKAFQFKPGSNLASMFQPGGTAKTQLDHLPQQPYLMAVAYDLKAVRIDQLTDVVMQRFEQVPQFAGFVAALKPFMPVFEQAQGYAQMVSAPQQPINPMALGMGGGMFGGISIIETPDAKATLQAYQQGMQALNNQKLQMPAMPDPTTGQIDPNAPPLELTYTANYIPNAIQIDGLQVDQYAVGVQLPPDLMAQNPQMAPLMMMAASGTQGYVTATDKYVIMTTTTDVAGIRAALSTLKGSGGGLGSDKMIEQVRQQLTADPVGEFYLNVGAVLQMGASFAAAFGGPQVQVPADLPPIAGSMSTADGAVSGRFYVPVSVVKAVKDLATQFQGMGGMGGMGGGEAPPAPF